MAPERIPTIVLGGTGYVAGDMLRLIAAHPRLELRAILSDSQPGEAVAKAFSHLAPIYPDLKFSSLDDVKRLVTTLPSSLILSAAPHGVSASLIDGLLVAAEAANAKPRVVDISADFRFKTAEAYAAVYKHAHGAPARLTQFTCGVPEHVGAVATPHVGHPGCFATAMLLACVPLLKLGLTDPRFFITGVTGSSGSGRSPIAGTHHPSRHSDLYSYNALSHRHAPEVIELAATASGVQAELNFIPHSGPFSRGIHVTLQAVARKSMKSAEWVAALADFYQQSPFVQVANDMPRVKDVVASNYARLSAVASGQTVAVMCVIDNLVKGAAGGAIQWVNRMYGFDEVLGLSAPAAAWT